MFNEKAVVDKLRQTTIPMIHPSANGSSFHILSGPRRAPRAAIHTCLRAGRPALADTDVRRRPFQRDQTLVSSCDLRQQKRFWPSRSVHVLVLD
jgi:hypothetical protein